MARYLLDTNALLWLFWKSPRLGPIARSVIDDAVNRVFISPVSIYEISYLSSIGRLEQEVPDNLESEVARRKFVTLDLTAFHAEQAGRLLLEHKDPFDRMLVAQALSEDLVLITSDAELLRHSVLTLNARR